MTKLAFSRVEHLRSRDRLAHAQPLLGARATIYQPPACAPAGLPKGSSKAPQCERVPPRTAPVPPRAATHSHQTSVPDWPEFLRDSVRGTWSLGRGGRARRPPPQRFRARPAGPSRLIASWLPVSRRPRRRTRAAVRGSGLHHRCAHAAQHPGPSSFSHRQSHGFPHFGRLSRPHAPACACARPRPLPRL